MTGLLQQYEFLATIEIPLQVITAISLLLRLVTKAFILKRFTFDDYVIIPAWVCILWKVQDCNADCFERR